MKFKKDNSVIEKIINEVLSPCQNESVWFSMDFLQILSRLNIKKRSEINDSLERTFKFLIDYGLNFKNLYIASFTNDFPKNRYFNSYETSPYIGSFSKFIFKKKYHHRSLHPFYSFYNFGLNKNDFSVNNYTDSHGSKSVFNFMINNNFKLITLGHHYVKSFPVIHHIESLIDVNYREEIFFDGTLTDNSFYYVDKYSYYSRKMEICDSSGLSWLALKKLEKEGIAELINFKNDYSNLYSYKVDIKKCSDLIVSSHSNENCLVTFFHHQHFPNKEFVKDSDAQDIYNNLY